MYYGHNKQAGSKQTNKMLQLLLRSRYSRQPAMALRSMEVGSIEGSTWGREGGTV